GTSRGDVVAILFDRSVELVVATLAVLKAGAAYLPIDTANPPERSAFIVRDARVKILVTGSQPASALLRELKAVVYFSADSHWQTPTASTPVDPVRVTDVAYVMYTSGSTGEPKGVVVPHQAITRLVQNTNYIHIDTTDVVAMAANPAFDAS